MNTENITIRLENPQDYRETENMVREAFWDVYRPGCNEHLIMHKLQESDAFIKELDFVACDKDKVVGIAVCPKAIIKNDTGQEFTVLSMIVGILPSYQKKGIGSMLVKKIMDEARSMGFKGIVLFGSPEYYPRFGFKNAKEYGIRTSEGKNLDPFMALELSKNSLSGINGKFYETSAYHVSDEELELFEKEFPHKEKHITDTQLK
jgi:predicted N-acetyltransferase YhbS